MTKKLLVIFVLSISLNVHARTFVPTGQIKQLHFWETVDGLLVIHQNMINPDACQRNDQYILDYNHRFFKEIYSMMLSAHFAGQPMKLVIDGCYQGFPRIAHVYSNK